LPIHGKNLCTSCHADITEVREEYKKVKARFKRKKIELRLFSSATGEVVGASAQGIGQALFEEFAYDDAGNPLTSTFAEYLFPAASELPAIDARFVATVATRNPLGARGVGEIGMVAAPSAVHGAVLDAVAHLGVRHVDMPCTPERVWRAIEEARNPTPGD